MLLRILAEKFSASVWVFVILAIGILGTGQAYAQVAGATLTGTVADASGSAIPKAQLTITDVSTGVARDAETDNAGFYSAPNLLPGTYQVKVTVTGFSIAVQTGITLTVGAQRVLNITMQVGQITQTIQISGEAPDIQLASSAITDTVDSTTVRELPLNGRSWTDLAALQPGVNAIQTQPSFATGGDRGNRGFGAQLTISGARPQQNNYRLDGVSLNDYANGAPGSVLGGNLGVDAIQEFSVITSNYSAEYGKTAGGVVNAITRSGTNQFHGSAYEFLRNSALDARNFFDPAQIPPFRRNQFGGSAGGPIRKDRTFIFADYEAIRQSKGITQTSTVPSVPARGGNLSTGTVTVDPSAAKYLNFFPLPNGPLLSNGDIGIFNFPAQQVVSENFVTSRIDHKFSDKDSVFGTYMYDATDYHSPDGLDDQQLGSQTKRQIVVIEETHIFSSALINTGRVGYNREGTANDQSASAINPLTKDSSLGGVPGQNASDVVISGISEFLGGINGIQTNHYYWNSFQAYDDAFLTHGTHSLKFGVAVERMDLNMDATGAPSGAFSFGTLSDFLTNRPANFMSNLGTIHPSKYVRQTLVGIYAQDDWRARSNLTLNLGLRYELTTVPKEIHNELSNLINITDPTHHLGSPLFLNPTLRNFEPRVGFAWDPFRNGKTAIRGGFGIFDVLPLPYQFNLNILETAPFFEQGTIGKLPPGSFYTGAFPLLTLSSLRQNFIEYKPKRDYVMEWNLNVQRQLTPNLTATVGYVGSHGVHQPFHQEELDNVIPQQTTAGFLFPSPVGTGKTINPAFGNIRGIFFESNSSYHALVTGIQKRMSRGLQAQGAFTWGKSTDDSSGSVAGDTFGNSIAALANWYDPKASHGVSDFNVGRTLVVNVTWDIPGLKSASGPVGWITDGWELGGIYTASDGIPFTATFGSDADPLGLNGHNTTDYPDRLTGPGCQTLINPRNVTNYIKTQCFTIPTAPSAAFYSANCDRKVGTSPQCFNLMGNAGRNILTGPGLSNLDFSIFKNNSIKRISDNFNVQFRAEVFNILNHANFLPPATPGNTDIFDSSGAPTGAAGLLTSTSTTAREIQFALKLIW
jgi:hypothetical protein